MNRKLRIVLLVVFLAACGFLQNLQETGRLPGSYLIPVEDCATPQVRSFVLPDSLKEEHTAEPLRLAHDLGTCRDLEGQQTVALFFVDDDESAWSAEDVRHFTNKHVLPALRYLQKQARRWGVELAFRVRRYSTQLSSGRDIVCDGTIAWESDDSTADDVSSSLATALGFGSDLYLHSHLMEDAGTSSVIPLFILNKSDRSYAWQQQTDGDCNFMEHCIIFADRLGQSFDIWKYTNTCTGTIAHEILHLFGADDYYYEEGEGRDKRSALAAKYYPNDVMLCDYDLMSQWQVHDVTAYSVGWTDRVPAICYNEDWYQ